MDVCDKWEVKASSQVCEIRLWVKCLINPPALTCVSHAWLFESLRYLLTFTLLGPLFSWTALWFSGLPCAIPHHLFRRLIFLCQPLTALELKPMAFLSPQLSLCYLLL